MTHLKAALWAILVLPVAAQAQESDDIIVTANGAETPRSQTGHSITVIDKSRLDSSQTLTIGDVLTSVPGVTSAPRGGIGGQNSAFIRGASSSQTLVLIDGVRVNDASSPNGAFDFGGLLTGNVDRVEVLRGPNSVIWGSQAVGGVISIRTLPPSEALNINTSAEYGYRDSTMFRGNVSGTTGPIEASFGASAYRTDGISSLANNAERDGFRNLASNGRIRVKVSEAVSLDLRGFYNRSRLDYDSVFAGPVSDPKSKNRGILGYAGLNLSLLEGKLRGRAAFSRNDIRRKGTDAVAGTFNNFLVKAIVDRFEYHGAFDATDAITLLFGVEHEKTRTSTSFEGAQPDRAQSKVFGGFLQAVVRPAPGLTVTGGVRHDDYSTYGGQTSLGGNIAYSPNEGLTILRATYAEGFRAPTVTEGQPPFGNADLKPETSRSIDVGVEQMLLDGALSAFVTYFRRKSDNQISFSFVSFLSENIDSVRASGVELGVTARPSKRLDVQASYSLINARNRTPGPVFGNRLELRPQDSVQASIDWRAPFGPTLGASLSIIGDSFDNAANSVRLDGYSLVDVRASFPIGKTLEIYGRFENLFDKRYQAVGGYNSYGRNAHLGLRARF